MKKLTLAIVALAALAITLPALAVNIDKTYTIPLNEVSYTNDAVKIAADGKVIDRIVVNNTAAFSNTVWICEYDAGVVGATLYSNSLAAGESETVYPHRVVTSGLVSNIMQHAVCNMRVTIKSTSGTTNSTTGPVRNFIQSR